MNEPPIQDNRILELDTWNDIIQSEGWRYFKDLLDEHIEYLNSQVLFNIDSRQYEKASEFRARAKECNAILSAVGNRLAVLKKQKPKEEEE